MYVTKEHTLSEQTSERVATLAEQYGVSFDAALEALTIEALDQIEYPELNRGTCAVFSIMCVHVDQSMQRQDEAEMEAEAERIIGGTNG